MANVMSQVTAPEITGQSAPAPAAPVKDAASQANADHASKVKIVCANLAQGITTPRQDREENRDRSKDRLVNLVVRQVAKDIMRTDKDDLGETSHEQADYIISRLSQDRKAFVEDFAKNLDAALEALSVANTSRVILPGSERVLARNFVEFYIGFNASKETQRRTMYVAAIPPKKENPEQK